MVIPDFIASPKLVLGLTLSSTVHQRCYRLALNVGYIISPVTVPTVSGAETTLIAYMDYTVIVSTPDLARELSHISLS